jgi:protein phosphatase 1 regulatory subunit 21
LQKRIRYWEKAKIKSQNDLKEAQNQIEAITEEAQTTSLNYENQLSLMSEHLANMNDKLTNQTDEIERLKYELTNKKSGSK